MHDNPWKRIYLTLMVLLALLMAVTLCASTVLADDSAMPPGPPPGPPPSAQCLAKGDYLYILDMRSIHKYNVKSLDFVQTVALPDLPAPPSESTTEGRPPMPPRASFIIEGDALFVTEMRSIHMYTLSGTNGPEFVKTVSLPEPDLPLP